MRLSTILQVLEALRATEDLDPWDEHLGAQRTGETRAKCACARIALEVDLNHEGIQIPVVK